MTLEELIASLTVEQAKVYAAETDALMWIETNLLDPNNIPRRYVYGVEDALIKLLK